MRLFFALRPDADVTRQLAEAARPLQLDERRGRLVAAKNYHVTLVFVGEVADPKLAVLQQIGRSLRSAPFTVSFDSLEYWRQSQAVVAVAPEAPPGLIDLWTRLNAAIGLPYERLRAHATLARKVAQAPVLQAMSPILWPATNFSLIRSDTGGAESAYTVLDTWPLLDETENR
ncbi:MAG TPA: RNA 2',3'-cyclic phosphodiesterase [Steroidobacteraceae bacterium]|nr:RNA 2',3'-cyclic phosphodiesterase [Steroidobacteraceae bacterium]